MSAKYWIAKYVEDVFRNEPKNVGVVVSVDGQYAARFVGERDDGVFDGRKLGSKFSHPQIYSQWRDYWRSEIDAGNVADVVGAVTDNYYVTLGGEVSDIGTDAASEVCKFLFSMLISEGGASEAYEWDVEADEQSLSAEITDLFKQSDLLANDDHLFVRHPIVRNAQIAGRHLVHKPSYVQRNGLLSVIEYIDLARPQQKHVRERAGYMGYMFADIKQADQTAKTYSIIRPADGEAVQYATSLLGSESQLVNWLSDVERGKFLEERRKVADSV